MKKFRFERTLLMVAALGLILASHAALAQDKAQSDLAKASQNPVASLISVPFENVSSFNNGPNDAYVNTLSLKPVLPVSLSKNWNLINRAIAPIIYQGETIDGIGTKFGIGDVTYQGFLSPAKPGEFIWGLGPTISFPTGAQRMTTDKWSAGPAFVGLTMPGNWVVGALAFNLWSFAGDNDAPDVNAFSFQYYVNYNLPKGWYLTMTPTITANWEADGDNRWTVPFGGGVGRVFKIGKQPVNLNVKAYYNAWRPDDASDWNITTQLSLMFPK
ncbi:MAG: neuromedin U [Desulfobacterales bacterium]|nr:neuromedin U [Desulfobacterales bacterium]